MAMFAHMKHNGHRVLVAAGLALVMAVGNAPSVMALTAGQDYTVELSQVNSDGSVTNLGSSSATADSNGKISFNFSSLPNANEIHFILMQIKDGSGNVVRQGIAPAPAPGETNLVGVNPLSNVQAEALRATMAANNSDDPLAMAFGLVFVRSENIVGSDIDGLSQMMATAIMGTGGMENFLLTNGVSQAELDTFKDRIVYNPAPGAKDMSDYIAYFKLAVDNDNSDDLAIASGLMADILIDAGTAAGIDPQLLMAAFDAAGDANGLDTIMASLSPGFQGSVMAAVNGFITRIGSVAVKKGYTEALSTLGGSDALIARFNTAVQDFINAQKQIDTQYGQYFMDPEGYLLANPGKTEQQVQQEIDNAFQTAWSNFQTGIRSTNAEISAMKTAVAAGLGMPASSLPPDLGQEYDFSGNPVNWPIPQTVAVTWVANILAAGGGINYTRDLTPVPSNMSNWLDSDDDPSNGIDGQRHDFLSQGIPADFAALMGLMEDVQIVENARYVIWDGGAQPTPAQRQQARLDFLNRLVTLAANITGTTDGSTMISAAEKEALIRLMMQPSLH